jgi:hypothetical protein
MASQICKLHRCEKRTRQFDIELVLVNTHWYLKNDTLETNRNPINLGNLLRSIQVCIQKGSKAKFIS